MSVLRTKKYIEEAIFSQSGNSLFSAFDSVGSLIRGTAGTYLHEDYLNSLIGVGTNWHGQLEVSLDSGAIYHESACNSFCSYLCRNFLLGSHQIRVIRRPKTQIHLHSGSAIGHQALVASNSYGTAAGFLVYDDPNINVRVFSNNHVLANSNNAQIGDFIYQYGWDSTLIGRLENFVIIDPNIYNQVDLAVASIDYDIQLQQASKLNSRTPRVGERVYKIGARTGRRTGIVASTDYTDKISYGSFDAVFINQIQIYGENNLTFSEGGDSGSLVYNANDHSFAALLFAGRGNMTLANPSNLINDWLRHWNYL